jgi:hypothetical protein
MTQTEYAKMIRSMHRIAGWTFIASIILSPIGIWVLRRGNRIYDSLTAPQFEGDDPDANRVLEGNNVETSLIMSWDDMPDTDPDR